MNTRLYPLVYRLREARLHPLAAIAALRRRLPAGKGLDTLTPVLLDANQSEGYERELALAMADPHVRNIAITGGYGAGKSSVIRTFKDNHKGFKFASVSLATFRSEGVFTKTAEDGGDLRPIAGPAEEPKSDEKKIATLIERIEETIVQQLLYAVPATKLPRTRLKRIMQPARTQTVWITSLLCLALLAAARLYLIAAFPPRTLAIEWLTTALLWIPASWAFVATCTVGAGLLYKLVRSLSLLNIDGWSIKGGTIESMQHSSVLHKNVDEIIYCFQNSRIDVVVIEDLDRFGIQDVFVRLREINAIINESPQIKRRVRFVYALNDELFAGSEKTKFFDMVLPVVPVINKENSHAKMVEGLRGRSLGDQTFADQIDDQLVETVSYRVDDMRLVKNIVNELDIFARVLTKDLPLDLDKLFAIITIKNLHSNHYWQLSKRTGFLYQLITGYPAWRNGRADDIRAEIADLEQVLERKRTDVARTVSELRGVVWLQAQIYAGASNATQLNKDGVWYDLAEFRDEETFLAFAAATSKVHFAAGRAGTGGPFRMADVLAEMDYDARFTMIETDIPKVESRIASKRDALRDNHRRSLSNALRDGYHHVYAVELAAHPLIAYFLDAAYLDEDYPDYLGHFYGHAIGREDMELVFTLRRGAQCDVAAVIREPAKFLKKLRPRNLDRGRGLIAELLLYLAGAYRAASQGDDADALARILDDAPTHLERFIAVLDILIERQQDASFLQAVYHLRSGLIEAVLASQGPNPSHVVAVLNSLGLEDLERLGNGHPSIKKRIGSMTDPSALVTQVTPSGDGWRWLKAAGVRFHRLNSTTSPEILSALVSADALSTGPSMLRLVALNGEAPETVAASLTVTRLLAADRIDGVDAFVSVHMRAIVARILEEDEALEEAPATVLRVVKALEGDQTMARQYFERSLCTFPTLATLPLAFWDGAMRGDRLEDPVDAVRAYEALRPLIGADEFETVDERTIRIILKDYASVHAMQLGQGLWNGGDVERLQEWIVTDPDLDDTTILTLLSTTAITSPALLTEALTDERLDLLVRHGRLAFSEAMWMAMMSRPLETQVAYLAFHWDQARQTPIETQLNFTLAARLYTDSVLSSEDAVRVFAAKDSTAFDGARALLGALAEDAATADIAFPTPLVDAAARLLPSTDDEPRWTKSLLVQAMPLLTWPQVSAALRSLGGDLAKVGNGRSTEVDPAGGVGRLLDALKQYHFISSLTPGKRGTKVNMKRKSRSP